MEGRVPGKIAEVLTNGGAMNIIAWILVGLIGTLAKRFMPESASGFY
jgi:uncharacterized membrane protein YeaQ/YmgE (transglycosylase-associated protein family)